MIALGASEALDLKIGGLEYRASVLFGNICADRESLAAGDLRDFASEADYQDFITADEAELDGLLETLLGLYREREAPLPGTVAAA